MLNEWNSIVPGDDVTGYELKARIEYLEDGDHWEGVETPEAVAEELASLREFDADLKTCGVLTDLTIVSGDAWSTYAAETFEDLYGREIPSVYIDHDKWADDLQTDYSVVDWEGHDYYVR